MNENIKILFQDKDLAVLEKPAGLVVHQISNNDQQTTLVDSIIRKWPALRRNYGRQVGRQTDQSHIGIVHRLDKDTSGLILIAKNPKAQKSLQEQFKLHRVKKEYTLLCFGQTAKMGKIKTQTSRDPKKFNKQKMTLMSFSWQKGKSREAITEYKTIKYFKFDNYTFSLVKAQIITGRTHQIRNHFNFIGHPIIGDQMYYTKESQQISEKLGLRRQFLHATQIQFQLPNHQTKKITCNLADDLRIILKKLAKLSSLA